MHHLLCAVQLVALRRLYDKKGVIPLVIAMPVNLRRMLDPPVSSGVPGLFIALPKLSIPVSEEHTPIEIARIIKTSLGDILATGEVLVSWKLLPRFIFSATPKGLAKAQAIFSQNPDFSMLTNMGAISRIDPFNAVSPVTNIHFAVAPPKDSLACLSACTYDGVMNINLCFNSDLLSHQRCDQVVRWYTDTLRLSE